MAIGAKPRRRAAVGRAQDHEQEAEGHHDLADEARRQRIAAGRVRAEAVAREAGVDVEARLAAGDRIEHGGAGDRAEHLRDDVGHQLGGLEPPARPQADRDRRIEMAARDVADRIGHGQDRQAERQRDAGEADAELRKRCGKHRGAASAKNQPGRSDEFGRKLAHHCTALRVRRRLPPDKAKPVATTHSQGRTARGLASGASCSGSSTWGSSIRTPRAAWRSDRCTGGSPRCRCALSAAHRARRSPAPARGRSGAGTSVTVVAVERRSDRFQPRLEARRCRRIVGLHEAIERGQQADDLLLARLEAAADPVMRHAAQVGAVDQLGRRPGVGRHVHVELLQQRRGHEIAPAGEDAGGLRPAQRLAAGEGDEVGAHGDEALAGSPWAAVAPRHRRSAEYRARGMWQ